VKGGKRKKKREENTPNKRSEKERRADRLSRGFRGNNGPGDDYYSLLNCLRREGGEKKGEGGR